MVTSNSIVWNPAVTQIVTQTLRQLGAIQDGEQPTGDMYADLVFQLNAIIKSAEATGLHVWTEEEGILFIEPAQVKYIIGGPTSSLNANTSDADEWLELTLSQSALGGATSIVLNVATVVSGQNIGVVMNDGTTFWTTVNGAPVGQTVTLTAPLPSAGTSAGNFALVYTTAINRPLRIPNARLLTLQGLNETPMTIMSRQEYMDQPNKLSPGTPTQWFYSPRRDQGLLYIWPAPVLSAWAIRFTWYRSIQDALVPGNTMDFPQEWMSALIFRLAKDNIGIYEPPPPKVAYIIQQDTYYWDLVTSYDRESEPIIFGMDFEFGQWS